MDRVKRGRRFLKGDRRICDSAILTDVTSKHLASSTQKGVSAIIDAASVERVSSELYCRENLLKSHAGRIDDVIHLDDEKKRGPSKTRESANRRIGPSFAWRPRALL